MCQVFDSNILFVVCQYLPLRDQPKSYYYNPSCAKMHELNLQRDLVKMRTNSSNSSVTLSTEMCASLRREGCSRQTWTWLQSSTASSTFLNTEDSGVRCYWRSLFSAQRSNRQLPKQKPSKDMERQLHVLSVTPFSLGRMYYSPSALRWK